MAWVNGELAGIGGVTIDPIIPGALRMRRFYVCPSFRRAGVGRELVTGLLRVNRSRRLITVNAGAESFPFWEALGFKTDKQDGHTHSFSHTEAEAILISPPRLPLVSFRPFREEDFPQLLAWFRAPHVARWWPVPDADDAVAAKYLPRIRGEEDARMSVILAEETPIGMIQTSPANQQHAAGSDACSIDLLIGEEGSIGVGLGSRVIEAFVTTEVFGRRGFSTCLADPHADNQRSIRAFEKAGFTFRRRFLQDSQTFLLLARCRSEPSS